MGKRAVWKGIAGLLVMALLIAMGSPVWGAEEPATGSEEASQEESARLELLQRWDELQQKRAELRKELAETERELRRLRRQLWPLPSSSRAPQEQGVPDAAEPGNGAGSGDAPGGRTSPEWITEEDWEEFREELRRQSERFWERLTQRLSVLGEELLPWVPDAVIDNLAQRTGRTPEEVKELIRSGQWELLMRKEPGEEEPAVL